VRWAAREESPMSRQAECVEFLQWALPRLRMRWPGFRKVRSQVCKRIARRLAELELDDLAAYRSYLEAHGDEWPRLDAMCRITISRFYRDRRVFEVLGVEVLPAIAAAAAQREVPALRAWSCGCASGEEAYTLAILWETRRADRFAGIEFEITATDADAAMLERARRGVFGRGSLRELPGDLLRTCSEQEGDAYRVRDAIRCRVSWLCQDVRRQLPEGPFDLVLCRNLVLTYFDEALQVEVMNRVAATVMPSGALVIGCHERLPVLDIAFQRWAPNLPIYRRMEPMLPGRSSTLVKP
jgi:chemotaxis protein methyltransferase CheR